MVIPLPVRPRSAKICSQGREGKGSLSQELVIVEKSVKVSSQKFVTAIWKSNTAASCLSSGFLVKQRSLLFHMGSKPNPSST